MSRVMSSAQKDRLFTPARIGWSLLLLVALLAPLVVGERQLFLLMTVMTLAVFATSYNIILGYTGLVSFAHGAFYGVGAYSTTLVWLHLGWSPLLGFALAPFVSGAVAYISGLVAFRAVRLYFALLTLGIGQLIYIIVFQWRSVTHGDDGIHGMDLPTLLMPATNRYYFLLGATVLALVLMAISMRSPLGATLQAIRENPDRVGFLGVKVKRYSLAAFTLGGAFAGYAGAMFALMNRGSFPLLMHWTTSAEPIFVSLIGGLNSFAGPLVGAIVLGLLRDYITRHFLYWSAVLGVVLLVIILRMPGGIVEASQNLSGWVRRRSEGNGNGSRSEEAGNGQAGNGQERDDQ